MLRLRTFGGLAVESDGRSLIGLAAYRRRIALLPLLAVAGERGISREKLVAYLWPESDTDHARHALTQTLYALRQGLGAEVVSAGPTELRLNATLISSDVGEFEAALERGEPEQAVTLYHGPFLDGFYLNNADEFERWADAERNRFAGRVSRALEQLAEAAANRGDHRHASEWWHRLALLEPSNPRAAVGLMSALARSGDRAGALRHARIYEALLRKELDIPPDPAVTALAARLRAEAEAAAEPVAVESGEAAAGTYEQYLKRALARRYDVQHELDRSKLAITYLARDLRHHRNVALKVIDAMLAASVDVERFLRELESVRQLEHANILPLHDVGEADGVLFCASPHIEAETLRDRLKRERQLPLGEALRIACEVADALSRAHEQRVLHRDLKPKNIVLDAGRALLSGLGLAGAIARAAGDAMTQTGVALGTPAYMSPEQAAGETQLDGRSDLYSLGCVLYQMLAGAPPLAGGTAQAVLARRWTGAPPRIRAVRDSVPVAVERALQRVLARSPADRFRTAAEFRDALGVC